MLETENIDKLDEPDYDQLLQKQDFFSKIFLMPSEIKLHQHEGLKVIKRNSNYPDRYEEEKVLPISINEEEIQAYRKADIHEKKKHPAGHGLLSLFKKTATRRIKLAICICVYSEPKSMLKGTIKGIQESYKYFLERAGILPHEIILTIIFDGIEKVNSSKDQTENMISFFNEIDLKNGFVHKPYGKSLDEYLKQIEEKKSFSQFENDKIDDISLFTEEQLSSLKSKLFENQYKQYMRIKKLLKQIQTLKKEKDIKFESLPSDINKKYEELSTDFCTQNNLYYETQEQIQQYLSTKKNVRIKLIFEAINHTELLCRKYIESRQDTSILYPVRLETDDLENPRENIHEDEQRKDKKKEYNYMFFVVKHKNQGKLSSHMLFFEGFCKLFDPEYCILADVGIKPHEDAIYRMWAHMEKKPKCGGVCGYMGLQLENPLDQMGYRDDGYDEDQVDCLTRLTGNFFTVQRAQQFEYHFSHMLDKPFEAAFGYIHVLPGAFSGYRWKTLKSVHYKGKQYPDLDYENMDTERQLSFQSDDSDEEEETLMRRYLKTATGHHGEISLEDSNMYLAEDRIMCLGIHSLGYDLDYLPDAQSTVDPVTSLTRLMGQRRRWINGSWFAFNYVRQHSYQRSTCIFMVQLLYYSLVQKLAWISPAMFYIAMNLTLIATVHDYVLPMVVDFFNAERDYELYNYRISVFNIKNIIESIPDVINFIYIMVVFSIILFSVLVNHNVKQFKQVYYFASSVLGLYGVAVIVLLSSNTTAILLDMWHDRGVEDFIVPKIYLRAMIIFIIVGHGLPIVWTFSFKKYVEIVTSLLSYLFYAPTYINILMVFAFCRIDDLSWGTKGLDADASSVGREWQRRKYIFVLQFVTVNVVFSYIMIRLSDFDFPRNIIIFAITILVSVLLLFRIVPAMYYLLKYYLVKCCNSRFSSQYVNNNLHNGKRILNALRAIEEKIKHLEKEEVKKKKKEEFQKVVNATSQLFSHSLRNFGDKLRSKVAQHMLNNNIIPKKELLNPKKKDRKKKINIRKKLKTVQEASNEQSQESHLNGLSEKKKQIKSSYDIMVPSKNKDIKGRIKALKRKKEEEIQ